MIWLALWTYVLVGLGVGVKLHEVHCQVVTEPPVVCNNLSLASIIFWPVLVGHSLDVGVK